MILKMILIILVAFSACLVGGTKGAPPPRPTASQLMWSRAEVGAMFTYNLATSAGTQGCNDGKNPPAPHLFKPTAFDAEEWVKAVRAMNASYVVFVVKHGCGFTLWDTKTKLPDGSAYAYSVKRETTASRDLVHEFAAACKKHGIGFGLYYSVVTNAYLNVAQGKVRGNAVPPQISVTQNEYFDIVLSQLHELWTEFGDLFEIWFDGGYQEALKTNITEMLQRYQPNAAAFGGIGVSKNPVRWIGTEAGRSPKDTWSTTNSPTGAGQRNGSLFAPAEADTTLQQQDQWFFNPHVEPRTLADLQSVYAQTVGHNTQLLLNIAPMPNGSIPEAAMKRYQEFGDWIRECFGNAHQIAATSGTANNSLVLSMPKGGRTVGRIVIEEDQTSGQLIDMFQVWGEPEKYPGTWQPLGQGQSIGNKRIIEVPDSFRSLAFTSLKLIIASPNGSAGIRQLAAFSDC